MMKRIVLVTDRRLADPRTLIERLGEAAAAGVDAIQIREKDLEAAELLDLTRAAVAECRHHGCRIFVNGRFDVALEAGADGVHLPADGLRVADVRRHTGARLILGVSTHSLEEARAAQEEGADYVFLGPVFQTPSKRDAVPLGADGLAAAARALTVPVYGIGGIDHGSAAALAALPIAGVAVIRAVLAAPDIAAAVGGLRAALTNGDSETQVSDIVPGEPDDEDDEPGGEDPDESSDDEEVPS